MRTNHTLCMCVAHLRKGAMLSSEQSGRCVCMLSKGSLVRMNSCLQSFLQLPVRNPAETLARTSVTTRENPPSSRLVSASTLCCPCTARHKEICDHCAPERAHATRGPQRLQKRGPVRRVGIRKLGDSTPRGSSFRGVNFPENQRREVPFLLT